MQITELNSMAATDRQRLVGRIPVFKQLQESHSPDLEALLSVSCVVELEPSETIMRRGDNGRWLYFLVRGGLDVYGGDDSAGEPLNRISPGEMFGDLAWLGGRQRRATVAAEPAGRGATLFACDFRIFGELEDFSRIGLDTKLRFLQAVVHSVRWRLEVARMQESAGSELAQQLRGVPVFDGQRGGCDELRALHQQALYMADLLEQWNSARASIQFKLPASLSDGPERGL